MGEKIYRPFGVETTYTEIAGLLGIKRGTVASQSCMFGLEETLVKKKIGNAATLEARLKEYRDSIKEGTEKIIETVYGKSEYDDMEAQIADAVEDTVEDIVTDEDPAPEVSSEPIAWKVKLAALNHLIREFENAEDVIWDLDRVAFDHMLKDLKNIRTFEFMQFVKVDWEELTK